MHVEPALLLVVTVRITCKHILAVQHRSHTRHGAGYSHLKVPSQNSNFIVSKLVPPTLLLPRRRLEEVQPRTHVGAWSMVYDPYSQT